MSKLPPSKNHPAQVRRRPGAPRLLDTFDVTDDIDDRRTPDKLWRELDAEFGFTVDAAASRANAKCERFYDLASNGLAQSWGGERVWCNPPYSALAEFVRKAHLEVDAQVIVMLLPANRCEQEAWQRYIEPLRDGRSTGRRLETRFISGRTEFVGPDGERSSHVPFGCVLVIWLADTREGPDE